MTNNDDNIQPIGNSNILIGYYSSKMEKYIGEYYLYEKPNGANVRVTSVCRQGKDSGLKWGDLICVGFVKNWVNTVKIKSFDYTLSQQAVRNLNLVEANREPVIESGCMTQTERKLELELEGARALKDEAERELALERARARALKDEAERELALERARRSEAERKLERVLKDKDKAKCNKAEEDNKDVCDVCLENKKTHAFNPCGHMCVCETCANKLIQSGSNCPICRADITSLLKIFT